MLLNEEPMFDTADTPLITSANEFRFLDRNGRFHQSCGVWNVSKGRQLRYFYFKDWFHSLLHLSTVTILSFLCLTYIIIIIVFAVLYQFVPSSCGLKIGNFTDSLYLSIEIITTLGFGLPNSMKKQPYFNDCSPMFPLLLLQSIFGILFDCVSIGILFSKISRGPPRATTVLFSDKLICTSEDKLVFRVCELRQHQLIECHLRCYIFAKQADKVVTENVKLSSTSMSKDGYVLLSIPTEFEIDISKSPLLRQLITNRCEFQQRFGEVIIILEGIDAATSYTIQATHSYTYSDIVIASAFQNCIQFNNGQISIDFQKFHSSTAEIL